jgi:hypothetical protein
VRLRLLLAIASLSISAAQGGTIILFSNVTSDTPLGAGAIAGASGGYLADAFEFTPAATGDAHGRCCRYLEDDDHAWVGFGCDRFHLQR